MAEQYGILKQSFSENFGEASLEELESLVRGVAHAVVPTYSREEVSVGVLLPHGALCLLAGAVQARQRAAAISSQAAKAEQLHANACATIRAFISPIPWTSAAASEFGQRLLDAPEVEFRAMTDRGSKEYSALCFLAGVLCKNMSAAEVAAALVETSEGQQWLETVSSSVSFGQLVVFSLYSFWDDIWNWIKGAAKWVQDAAITFGTWATKAAKAVVDAVFAKYKSLTKFLEVIPGVGLLVAGIYALAGDSDHALAALAINLNAIVTYICSAVGAAVGGIGGGMAGGTVGKAVGLFIQKSIAKAIKDPDLKAEVGDISAVRLVVEVALAGAVSSAAGAIADVLAKEAGLGAVTTFITSKSLPALLASLPAYFIPKDI